MECPKLKPQFLKKYKKYTPSSTKIDNVIENVIDFLYFLCTFEITNQETKVHGFRVRLKNKSTKVQKV